VYRIGAPLYVSSRNNLVFNGNGATIRYGTTSDQPLWYDTGGGSHLTFENFILIGGSTSPGVYVNGTESQQGIVVISPYVEVAGCTFSALWGDAVLVTSSSPSWGTTANNVWIHNNHVITTGRTGLSIIAGSNVLVEQNAIDRAGHHTFNIEPNFNTQSVTDVTFRNNTAGSHVADFLEVGAGNTGSTIGNVTVSGNTVTGGTLLTVVDDNSTAPFSNIVVTNNTSTVAVAGPVLFFVDVNGLTVAGNAQPLTSGSLTRTTTCTNVAT
jgi:hypothetical protein